MRSGRIRIPASGTKVIVYVPSGSSGIRYYRIYNSGRDKTESITVIGADTASTVAVMPRESIDIGVKNTDLSVKAGATEEAEVVYDFLG